MTDGSQAGNTPTALTDEELQTLRLAHSALAKAADEIHEVADLGLEVDRAYFREGGDGYEVQRALWELIEARR